MFFSLDEQDVLIFSPQHVDQVGDRFSNLHSSVYTIGQLDYKTGEFSHNTLTEINYGFDFYAPQTLLSPDGRRIMIAWMGKWESKYPADTNKHGWTGTMTLPREIRIKERKLYFKPIKEIENYRKNYVSIKNEKLLNEKAFSGVEGYSLELEAIFEVSKNEDEAKFGIKVLCSDNEYTKLYYDYKEEKVIFDRNQSGEGDGGIRKVKVKLEEGRIKLRLFEKTRGRLSCHIIVLLR